MPDPNLILDVVNFVSLVDDPAVGDSEWVVMKRQGEETPDTIQEALEMAKHGRTLSQANQQRLSGILEALQEGKVDAGAQELEAFLQETVEEPEGILPDGSGDIPMDPEDLEKLVKSVEQSAEAAQEAAESAEAAAQEAQEASGENQTPEGESPEGGQEEQDPGVSEEVMDRIDALESRLQEAGVIEEQEDPEGSEGSDGEGSQEGQAGGQEGQESDLEKRLKSIEKSLEQGGRAGVAGVEDPDDTWVRKDSGRAGVKDTQSLVEKAHQQAAEEGGD